MDYACKDLFWLMISKCIKRKGKLFLIYLIYSEEYEENEIISEDDFLALRANLSNLTEHELTIKRLSYELEQRVLFKDTVSSIEVKRLAAIKRQDGLSRVLKEIVDKFKYIAKV